MASISCELIDHMGNDLRVANAARVSMAKESSWAVIPDDFGNPMETTILSSADAKLIGYLAKHEHWTPFAHCMITLRETVPIFVARQRFKHVVGFVYNEVSRRYVDDEPEFYTPDVWRKRAENVKQGSSSDGVDDPTLVEHIASGSSRMALGDYSHLLSLGVAPELARMVLPQSMMTSYYVTGSLAAFARAYILRSDAHAQKEIRDLAKMWDDIIRPLFPVSWSALTQLKMEVTSDVAIE